MCHFMRFINNFHKHLNNQINFNFTCSVKPTAHCNWLSSSSILQLVLIQVSHLKLAKIIVPISRYRDRHLKQNMSNTCLCISISALFIKSMNYIEHLKKQKFPNCCHSGGLRVHRGTALLFPSLTLLINSSDRKHTPKVFTLQRNEL